MAELLNDVLNLRLLKLICRGEGLSINYSELSKKLKYHRDTIHKKTDELFKNNLLSKPVFPFFANYYIHQMLVIVQAELPHDNKLEQWIKSDDHIFAAYKLRRGGYNTLLILFHKNITHYTKWRTELVKTGKIPPRDMRFPSSASFFSTQNMIKYNPAAPAELLGEVLKEKGNLEINGYKFSKLSFDILHCLLNGTGIKVNESYLAKKLNVSRKTIQWRIKKLLDDHMIITPVCRFPAFFGPPDSVLVIEFLEIKKEEESEVIKKIKKDPHISMGFRICSGRYNYLLFEVFKNVGDHIKWQNRLGEEMPGCFGTNDAIYLTPNMMFGKEQQEMAIETLDKMLKRLRHPPKEKKWWPFVEER